MKFMQAMKALDEGRTVIYNGTQIIKDTKGQLVKSPFLLPYSIPEEAYNSDSWGLVGTNGVQIKESFSPDYTFKVRGVTQIDDYGFEATEWPRNLHCNGCGHKGMEVIAPIVYSGGTKQATVKCPKCAFVQTEQTFDFGS